MFETRQKRSVHSARPTNQKKVFHSDGHGPYKHLMLMASDASDVIMQANFHGVLQHFNPLSHALVTVNPQFMNILGFLKDCSKMEGFIKQGRNRELKAIKTSSAVFRAVVCHLPFNCTVLSLLVLITYNPNF